MYLYFLLLLCVYRIAFIVIMREYITEGAAFADILQALWSGFRISLKSAGVGMLLTFVFCTLPATAFLSLQTDRLRRWLGYSYTALLSVLFLARFPYYEQFHVNFNQNIFNTFKEDAGALLVTIVQEYNMWFYLPAAALLTAFFCWGLRRMLRGNYLAFPRFSDRRAAYAAKTGFLLAIGVAALFLRFGGSFNYAHSINYENAGTTRDFFLNEMILDDVQALYRAYKENRMGTKGESSSVHKEQARAYAEQLAGGKLQTDRLEDYFLRHAQGPKLPKPKHIFVIIGESYAQWPLLDKYAALHIGDGLRGIIARENAFYNKRFLPVGIFTAQTMNGIVTGFSDVNVYPTYQPETYKAVYATAIAAQFKALGYKTVFWHGGYPSSGRMEEFTRAQGFDEYYGCSDLHLSQGNIWGAKDRDLFQAIGEKMQTDTPTFHLVMTVINHPPYNLDIEQEGFDAAQTRAGLPEALRGDKNLLNMLGHYWYMDDAVSKFVTATYGRIPESLFVITGDHANRLNLTSQPTIFERYTIPFVLFGNGVRKDILPTQAVGNHLNIAPTLVELIAPEGFAYHSISPSLSEGNAVTFSQELWMTDKALGKIDGKEAEVFPWLEAEVDLTLEKEKTKEQIARERTLSWWRLAVGNALPKEN